MLPLDIAYGALPKLNSPILTVLEALLFQSPKPKKTVLPYTADPLRFDKLTAEFGEASSVLPDPSAHCPPEPK